DRGDSLARIADLVEACAEADFLSDLLCRRREELSNLDGPRRLQAAERMRAEGEEAIRELVRAIHEFALSTMSPSVVQKAVSFVEKQVGFRPFGMDLGPGLLWPLRLGLSLPAELRVAYLTLLNECHGTLWDP